jgi:hypothetical protein
MYTYAHSLVSAILAGITCTVIFTSAITDRRSETAAFPVYKPTPSLVEARRHDMLVGKWAGKTSLENGALRRVLIERTMNGTFTVTVKTELGTDDPVIEQQVGQWGISGPVYFTITTGWLDGDHIDQTDLGQPYYYDAYRIIDLSKDRFEFESVATNTHYLLRRIADDFTPADM